MKKIDKLILKSFLGPFLLTFCVVEFILLCITLIKYFEDIVGKDLGAWIYVKLVFFFCLNIVPVALPLGILLSSIMTYGNLGEHKELTALKSAGISLLRLLRPIFFLVILITTSLFFFNEKVVTWANLNVFSLLYDVRQMKPTLDFKEKIFYNGLPGYSIKIDKKYPDGRSLKNVQIYDHTKKRGNTDVIVADSGIMYMIKGNKYLVLELFNGNSYSEYVEGTSGESQRFLRSQFKQSKMVFSMESFGLDETNKDLFKSHKMMMTRNALKYYSDSLYIKRIKIIDEMHGRVSGMYNFYLTTDTVATRSNIDDLQTVIANLDTLPLISRNILLSLKEARNVKGFSSSNWFRIKHVRREAHSYLIEYHKRFTQPFACLILFLIGAPLGAIIKKGGLGVPVLISIVFFIILYVTSEIGWKWGREGRVDIFWGVWFSNIIMLPVGFFFLLQARNDSNILEFEHWKSFFLRFKKNKPNVLN